MDDDEPEIIEPPAESRSERAKKRTQAATGEAGPSKIAKPAPGTTAPGIRTSISGSSFGGSDTQLVALRERISKIRRKATERLDLVMGKAVELQRNLMEVQREVRMELDEVEDALSKMY